jgi:hypothetical protein
MIDILNTQELCDLADLIDEAELKLRELYPECTIIVELIDEDFVMTVDITVEELREFDRLWWTKNCHRANWNLCITTW